MTNERSAPGSIKARLRMVLPKSSTKVTLAVARSVVRVADASVAIQCSIVGCDSFGDDEYVADESKCSCV